MKMNVTFVFTEELLGTKPANKKVFADYIASKAPDDELREQEVETAEHCEESHTTIFHKDDQGPFLYDYQVKGFLKDAAQAINWFDKDVEPRDGLEKLTAFKSKIDKAIFVYPRHIRIMLPDKVETGTCERPLRAETAQGPRVSLAKSETAPIGATISFELLVCMAALKPYVEAWLKYGKMRGMGQWRNSGKGRFVYQLLAVNAPVSEVHDENSSKCSWHADGQL
jgi:hypothetical protein